jgi:hypothetical protein
MALLRRVLYWQATLWAVGGLLHIAVPRWLLETVFRQTASPDLGYVRASGIMAVGLALLMVLVAQRIEEVWWWAWAFALTDAALATLAALNALFGPAEGTATAMWWLFAAGDVAFGAALLAGMARAGQEKPFV